MGCRHLEVDLMNMKLKKSISSLDFSDPIPYFCTQEKKGFDFVNHEPDCSVD